MYKEVCRMIFVEDLSFNLVKTATSKRQRLSEGQSYLQKEVERIDNVDLEKYMKQWSRTSCTSMSDCWADNKSRSITIFCKQSKQDHLLKSINTSAISKSGGQLFDLLDFIFQEVGMKHVMHVVAHDVVACLCQQTVTSLVRRLLHHQFLHIFQNLCVAHCINILNDIVDLSTHKSIIEKARKIMVFIYLNSLVRSLMRYSIEEKEMKRPRLRDSLLIISLEYLGVQES